MSVVALAPAEDVLIAAPGHHYTVEQKQQWQDQLREAPTWFHIGGKKELNEMWKAAASKNGSAVDLPEGLIAYIEERFASLLPNTTVHVELALDDAGALRGFGSMVVGDYPYAQSIFEEIGRPRANGLPGFEIRIGDAFIQVGPPWGKGATAGSRRMLSTTRRNAANFVRPEFAALISALERDPHVAGPADVAACRQLELNLQEAVRRGLPPSFEDGGARALYTLERLPSRAGHVFDALLSQAVAVQRFRGELFASERQCLRVASLAGGPGFDIVGFALLAKYLGSTAKLECTVFDREMGWGDQMDRVVKHLRDRISVPELEVRMAPCDVTLPLAHEANADVEAAASSADIFIISYVVHEVESLLRAPLTDAQEGVQGLLPDLFRRGEQRVLASSSGQSVSFWFFDASTRLWPAIAASGERHGFECFVPHMLRSNSKPQEPLFLTRRHPDDATAADSDFGLSLEKERRHAASRFAAFERYLGASDSWRMASCAVQGSDDAHCP